MMIVNKKPEVLTISGGNKGFTLAEVLITLGIIGIVAAMTIPTLIANNQKIQYVTALKKVYSNVNQVLVQYSADNGCVGDLKCTGLFAASNTATNVGDALAPYFSISQNCKTATGCFSSAVSANFDGSWGRGNSFQAPDTYRFTTLDGVNCYLLNYSYNCEYNTSTGATGDMQQLCGEFIVDVNGDKGPNNLGRDIFWFYITNGRGPKLYPFGGQDDGNDTPWDANTSDLQCDGSNVAGNYCAGRVIEEGWQMNY